VTERVDRKILCATIPAALVNVAGLQQAIERLKASAPTHEWEEANRSRHIDIMNCPPQIVGGIDFREKRVEREVSLCFTLCGAT